MNIINVQWIHLFLRVTDKRIILVSILLIISLTSRIGATRFKEHRQQWTLKGNNPNLKVKYDTTIDMTPDAEHEIEREDGVADMKTVENRASHSETVDKAGGCRNVNGILKREMEVTLDKPTPGSKVSGILSCTGQGQVDRTYPGHVGLANGASGDEREKRQSKEQESRRTGTVTELFEEQFSAMETYFTELLGEADDAQERRKKKKYLKKMLVPLLIAYKLKFVTMAPLLIAVMVLLAGSTGIAGFFFALFLAAVTQNRDE